MARSYTRAEQRKHRLLQMENEQRIEEFEALKMTDEQRQILLRPFTSVKVEFSDLDGLHWTSSALRRRQVHQSHCSDAPQKRCHVHRATTTFVVLTNADLAAFSGEDTIRASVTSTSSMDHRNGKRSRSPLKGLFPVPNAPAASSSSATAGFPAWNAAGKKDYVEGHDDEEGVNMNDDADAENIDDEPNLDDSDEGELTFVAEHVDLDLNLDEHHSDRIQHPYSFVDFRTSAPFPLSSSSDIETDSSPFPVTGLAAAAGQQFTFADLYPTRPPSRMDLYYDQ